MYEEEKACPNCGSVLIRKINRDKGTTFWSCSSFPECRYTEKDLDPPDNPQDIYTNSTCPICKGKLRKRNGSNGSFYGCSGYPECRYTEPDMQRGDDGDAPARPSRPAPAPRQQSQPQVPPSFASTTPPPAFGEVEEPLPLPQVPINSKPPADYDDSMFSGAGGKDIPF